MGLPPVSVLAEPVTCYPPWHRTFARYGGYRMGRVTSCPVDKTTGNVPCPPAELAAEASRKLGTPVSLEAYTLARYIATEVGTGTAEEKVAVAQAAINRARYVEKLPRGVVDLLLYRQKVGHPNRGFYGPIHGYRSDGSVDVKTAPWGRWAATSFDPTYADVILALAVLDGVMDGFAKGADDQDGIEYFTDPVASVKRNAAARKFWVGPLPGVNHWRTFLYRKVPEIAPDSPAGVWLTQRAIAAVSDRRKPSWALLPVCDEPSWRPLVVPAAATFVGAAVLAVASVSIMGRRRGILGRSPDAWWKERRRPTPERLCYRTKTDALRAFRDANQDTIEAWGGLDAEARPADFDAINHKYGLKGRRAVRTLARALWVAAGNRPPYCLDAIDLDALNDTAPGRAGRGFTLPTWALELRADREQARHYEAERRRVAEERAHRAFDRALAKRGLPPDDVPF